MASGHVHIRTLCVVSSSDPRLGQINSQQSHVIAAMTVSPMSAQEHGASLSRAFLSTYSGELDYSDPAWFNLSLWISSQPIQTHAILIEFCLLSEDDANKALQCSGIIIQERPTGSLAKIAHFHFFDRQSVIRIGEVERVDWLIS